MVKSYAFPGAVKYIFADRKDRYDNYSVAFYPSTPEVRRTIKATGIRNSAKEDQDGNWFYSFRSKTPIEIELQDALPDGAYVGHGSEVTLHFTVEDFMSKTWGKVIRSKPVKIVVTKVVPYIPEPKTDEEIPS
jgi:hypothetical protein